MTVVQQARPGHDLAVARSLQLIEWLAIFALVAGLVLRFLARPDAPLWLDETATGAIVTQPDFASFLREVRWDVEAPLYYFVLRPWVDVFGASDAALRAPGLLFSLAAPLVIAFAPIAKMNRADRLAWAALVALWTPGAGFAQDARCYSLALLLAALQTVVFIHLMSETSNRSVAAWVGCCALTTAAHYDAALLALAQGLIFLAVKRTEALKRWWTLLLIAPVVALLAWQWPEMTRVFRANWYKLEDLPTILGNTAYLVGARSEVVALPILLAAAVAIRLRRKTEPAAGIDAALWLAGAASAAGAGAQIILGAVRPMLTARYLGPFEPGVALLVLATLRATARGSQPLVLGGLVAWAAAVAIHWLSLGAYHLDSAAEQFNWEQASTRLMNAHVRKVVFAWDSPPARVDHPETLAAFGGFFFRRADYPVEVVPVQLFPGQDPNRALLQAAEPGGAAILWVYDTKVDGTLATSFPPRIDRLDPRWRCDQTGGDGVGVVTCIPPMARPAG